MYYYLGQPYTSNFKLVERLRYKAALACLYYFRDIATIYSPIVHYHQMAVDYKFSGSPEFYATHNKNMLEFSNGLIVFKLKGWKESKGLEFEIKFAKEHNINLFSLTSSLELGVFHG